MKTRRILLGACIAVVTTVALAAAKCPLDDTPLNWFGDTQMSDSGKLLKVFECLNGHKFLLP